MGKAFGYLIAALVALGTLIAVYGRDRTLTLLLGPVITSDIEFATLKTADRPNWYLVCPDGYCAAVPYRVSPIFPEPARALRDRWMRLLDGEPRITRVRAIEPQLQYDFVQRSLVFRFPDTITVRFISLGEEQSTLAIYSRSHYGYRDLGVNKRRVEAWLAALTTE